jgi:pimeloyl-ACP methyl ester carboxylesterase
VPVIRSPSSAPAGTATRFEVAIPDQELEDLRARLRNARLPEDFANEEWRYGIEGNYLRSLIDYWVDEFDWRAQENEINRLAHYRTVVDNVPIHFVLQEGRGRRRIPLILTHGWPCTFWDFKNVIGPLSDPASHGLDDALAFDVVVPSLPGYAFSSPLRQTGVSRLMTAGLWTKLMRDVLGYDRFGAQGGDWGAIVSSYLAHAHAQHVIGVHLNLPAMLRLDFMESLSADSYAPDEQELFNRFQDRWPSARAHRIVHRDAPQTLAVAMSDSPAGFAAWVVERRRAWSDCDGDVEASFDRDFLLTGVSLIWLTHTIHTSMRSYADEDYRLAHNRMPVLEAPVGVAVFPMDTLFVPRELFAAQANLVRWTVMPRGGHFAAAEEPALLVDDVRAFFAELA